MSQEEQMRATVLQQLAMLPSIIGAHYNSVANCKVRHLKMKAHLQSLEDDALLTSTLDGKNAEIRAAQLRERCLPALQALQQAEAEFIHAAADLDRAQTEFAAARAMARMLSVTKGEE